MNIAYVNLFVSDIDRAVEFYTLTLGLKLNFSDSEHGYASIGAGSIQLGLAVTDSRELLGRHTGIGLAVEDLEAEHKRLKELGVTFESPPTRQPWGGFMALMNDPDGNIFYLDQVSSAHPSSTEQ